MADELGEIRAEMTIVVCEVCGRRIPISEAQPIRAIGYMCKGNSGCKPWFYSPPVPRTEQDD